MRKLRISVLIFCFLVFAPLTLGGCNNKSVSTPDEAYTETQVLVTESSVTEPLITETSVTETEITEKSQRVTEQGSVSDFTLDSKEDSSQKPCIVNVDGKAYTFYVGDTVTYVFYLETAEALEDFQATTYYDSSMLELIDTGAAKMFPIAKDATVYNTGIENSVKFNAVDLNGMDFTKGGYLVSFDFIVLDSGSVAISTTLEYMDSVLSEPYVNDFRIVGDINYSEEIK